MSFNERLRTLLSEPAPEAQACALRCERLSDLLANAIPDADPALVREALAHIRADQVRRRMDALAEEDGPWTAHDINLAPGVQTLDAAMEDSRLRRILQVAADLTGKRLDQIRVLDLGCLEGQFALEFALHGAQVVAVEARSTNLRKSRFAAEALGVDNLEFREGDVRRLNQADYGTFDVVLCLGILYHLDAPDVLELVRSMASVCRGLVIIDSHFSLKPRASVDWKGRRYWGDFWTEYSPGSRAAEEEQALWSSIGNDRSFLLTRPSLCNLLRCTGFTSVYECLNPYEYHSPNWPLPSRSGRYAEWPDRSTFVALKGRPAAILTSPVTDLAVERDRPERSEYLQPILPAGHRATRFAGRLLTGAARRLMGRG